MGAFIKAAGLDHIQIEIRINGMYMLSEIRYIIIYDYINYINY